MNQVETSHTSSSWKSHAVFPSTVTDPETGSELIWGPAALEQRRQRTREHLAQIAPRREGWITNNRYYYELLARLLRFLVEPQKRVLSVRCDTGNLSLSQIQTSSNRHSGQVRHSTTSSSMILATPWTSFKRFGI
jgi:hypothetical protein